MSIQSAVLSLLLLVPLIVATEGCQSTPNAETKATPASHAATPVTHAAAARAPAPSPGAAAARGGLGSAESLLRDGDLVGARAALSVLPRDQLPDADQPRYALLAAELAIRSGEPREAEKLLTSPGATHLPDPVDALLVDAWLTAAAGQPARGASELMRQEIPTAARARVNDAIWSLTVLTPAFTALALADVGTDAERGWWSLRRELLMSASRADQRKRIRTWQATWPQHPASLELPMAIREPGTPHAAPRRVALLLPLSGPLARAGRTVRDGFMAAYLDQPPEQRFAVAIYDTNAMSVQALYQRALAEGADLIVGPLERDAVAVLNDLAPQIPVLALNYLAAGDPAPNLAQLGLAVEDDAATLATWLREQGYLRILLLQGSEDWTLRARRALHDQGIEPVGTYVLPDLRTVTESVGTALHIKASEDRHAEIERILNGPVQFRSRSRSDVDAVIALVNAVEVTALVPALRFHYADSLPAFATGQTLQGSAPATLRAMDGFNVVELPWLAPGDPTYQKIAGAFPLEGNPFKSMYALGADALRMTDRINPVDRGVFTQILGSTGVLTLTPSGRLTRELARMRIDGGHLSMAAPAGL